MIEKKEFKVFPLFGVIVFYSSVINYIICTCKSSELEVLFSATIFNLHIKFFCNCDTYICALTCIFIILYRAGYGSESEADEEAATVSLTSDLGRVNRASSKSAVKLQEIGPRMTLELIKIEEGLCSGQVLFSIDGR